MADTAFKDFIVDQLATMSGLKCRTMFGGYGLYCNEIFFGIIHRDRLYFKTDGESAAAYLERGMDCFQPNEKQKLIHYYEVPPDVMERADQLRHWAMRALQCK
jgi:DNA transformation protein